MPTPEQPQPATTTTEDKSSKNQQHAGPSSNDYDDRLLHQAVQDAGRWAFGTVLVELWVLSDDQTCLYRPSCGWWVDPVFHNPAMLHRLTDPDHPDYIPPAPLAPGEGLTGILWSESSSTGANSARTTNETATSSGRPDPNSASGNNTNNTPTRRVVWRNIPAIANDPDQPWNPRLQLLAQLGLGWVAAVRLRHAPGLVVYLARGSVNLAQLREPANEEYLRGAADLIGAAYRLRQPRQVMVQARYRESSAAWHRVKLKIRALRQAGIRLDQTIHENSQRPSDDDEQPALLEPLKGDTGTSGKMMTTWSPESFQRMAFKVQGGRSQPPPPMPVPQTALTFFGVFVTLLILTRLNVFLKEEFGGDYSIVLGPFGALMTLLYGLSAAPASQPRNAIWGQAVSLTIAILVGKLDHVLEPWLRQTIATSLAVSAMVKLGITHPPAGAAALIFSSGNQKWSHMLMILVGDVIAVVASTLINNLSPKRQYPMYWTAYDHAVTSRKE